MMSQTIGFLAKIELDRPPNHSGTANGQHSGDGACSRLLHHSGTANEYCPSSSTVARQFGITD
jgi:hypothetical protein